MLGTPNLNNPQNYKGFSLRASDSQKEKNETLEQEFDNGTEEPDREILEREVDPEKNLLQAPSAARKTPSTPSSDSTDTKKPASANREYVDLPQPPAPTGKKSDKDLMIGMGYPAHLIHETKEGKAFFDFGAAEDEALFNALNSDSETEAEGEDRRG